MSKILLQTDIPVLPKPRRGKVRDIFDLDRNLLIVATDRLSAFDCIMPNGIPGKGKVLTAMSVFWFDFMNGIVPNHLIAADFDEIAEEYLDHLDLGRAAYSQLEGRSMLVRKAEPLKVECVARGYITGGGWKEYLKKGSICGIQLPPELIECQRLPETLFTPTSKAETGHDESMTFEEVCNILGLRVAHEIRELSLEIYEKARAYAEKRGIIIADTKFEFGLMPDGTLILIDEVLTPDSSRFWPRAGYEPGHSQPSFDKQGVRDYLESIGWDGNSPAPELPANIVAETAEKYQQIRDMLLTE